MAKYILVVEVPDDVDQADVEKAAESLMIYGMVRIAVSPVAHRLYAATCRGGYVGMIDDRPGYAELDFGPEVLTTDGDKANREAFAAGGKVLEFLVPEPDYYEPNPVASQLPQLEVFDNCVGSDDVEAP